MELKIDSEEETEIDKEGENVSRHSDRYDVDTEDEKEINMEDETEVVT